MALLIAQPSAVTSAGPLGRGTDTAGRQAAGLRGQRLNESFNVVAAVRELSDGRCLLIDQHPPRVLLADWTSNRVVSIARQGSGPGEYRAASALLALGADSTLLVDGQLSRWVLFVTDHPVRTSSASEAERLPVRGAMLGADRTGHLLVSEQFASRGFRHTRAGSLGYGDSARMTLLHRDSRVADTVARLSLGRKEVTTVTRRVGGASVIYHLESPLALIDQAILYSDGWIAIAYAVPYRVDWRDPTGRWIRGARLGDAGPSIREADKEAAIARTWLVPWYTGPRWRPNDFSSWPSRLPPFEKGALLPTPDGELLIRRTPVTPARNTRYDLIDRQGRSIGTLTLPLNERITGVGAKWVYVASRDSDDVEALTRYPWSQFRDQRIQARRAR